MTRVMIELSRPDGTESRSEKVFSFLFMKESYTPYTSLNIIFASQNLTSNFITDAYTYSEVRLYINSCLVHQGIIDHIRVINTDGFQKCILKSRGFTSLLLDNQFEPGLHTNISINNLMDDYYTLPKVTHEDSTQSGYIYVKSGSSMWDALVNLSYKMHGTYPYISSTNMVKMSIGTPNRSIVLNNDIIINKGTEMETTRLASDFHMADINNEYGGFYYENTEAKQKNIVRNRYFELDRRFLYEPVNALGFRNAMAARGFRKQFCTYCGYNNEDLFDAVSFGTVTDGRIRSIKVMGDRNGIKTELAVYDDSFTPHE